MACVLRGSSIPRIAGDLVAALLRTMNWKPSLDSRITERVVGSDMVVWVGLWIVGSWVVVVVEVFGGTRFPRAKTFGKTRAGRRAT